jgi:hypothetical protein
VPSLATFVPEVGTRFGVLQAGVTLQLVEARALSAQGRPERPANDEQPFALLFQGRADRPLTQATYALDHAALGRMAMFLVPVMRPKGGHQRYEAVFNPCPNLAS